MDGPRDNRNRWSDLISLDRPEMMVFHKTWLAFFLTFFVWFNMAPLATTLIGAAGLTLDEIKLLAVCNVALTAPARFMIVRLTDRFGPRRTFSSLMVAMSLPCVAFAFSDTYIQMLVSRLLLSVVGAGFVVGIHMTSLWFAPRDIGFVQGVEAGLGNWGSAIAAAVMPVVALDVLSPVLGPASWRYSIAISGVVLLAYGVYYWFAVTDGPGGWKTKSRGESLKAIEVGSTAALVGAVLWTVPISGVLGALVWVAWRMGVVADGVAWGASALIALVVLYQVFQVVRANAPVISGRGGGGAQCERPRYRFTDVVCLCVSYAACFGAELATVSMLPMFFNSTWDLTPQTAGLLAAIFPCTNFFARALGAFITDRAPSRRASILICLGAMACGFLLMSVVSESWPLWLASAVVLVTALFVVAAVGMTFAIVPLVKRRLTGQISGYVGAYGNVGAILFLVAYMFLSDRGFFLMLGGASIAAFMFNYLALKEPAGEFAEEYRLSRASGKLAEGGN